MVVGTDNSVAQGHTRLTGPVAGAGAFVLLAGAMVAGNGRFTYQAIVLALAAFGGLILLARRASQEWKTSPAGRGSSLAKTSVSGGAAPLMSAVRSWEIALGVALLFCLALGLTTKPGEFVRAPAYRAVLALINIGLMVAVSRTFLHRSPDYRRCRLVFVVAVVAGFGLRLAMLKVSPSPVVDVFVEFQESAAHLLAGLNPYSTAVSDVYRGTQDYGYHLLGYAYMPGNLFLQTAAYALAGDIRYASIAAEAVVAVALYRIGAASAGRFVPMLAVLLFLFHPRGLLVIEQAWTEPLIAGAFGLFLWWRAARPYSVGPAAAYGYMLSLKQYLVYFVLHLLMIERRPKALCTAAAAGLLTLVPFLAWDAASLYTYGVKFQLETPFRPDGLTVVALLYRVAGFTAGKWLAGAVGLVVAGYTYARFRRAGLAGYLLAVTLTTFSIFLAGSQAFCNYYYLVSVFCLFTFVALAGDDGRRLQTVDGIRGVDSNHDKRTLVRNQVDIPPTVYPLLSTTFKGFAQ